MNKNTPHAFFAGSTSSAHHDPSIPLMKKSSLLIAQRRSILAATFLTAMLAAASSAQAANRTWSLSDTDNTWATAANWGGTAPVNNDTIEFLSGTPTFSFLSNNLSSLTLNGITFDSGSAAYTIYGNSVTLNGGITNNSTSIQRINTALALAATETINTNTGAINLTGIISGATFGLTKTGSGLLNLTGVNTYTGATTISGGTVGIVADTGLGASAAALSLDGGTLKVTGGTTPVNTHALSVTANGGTINNAGFAYTLNATLSGSNTLNLTGPTAGSVGYAGPVVNGLGNYGNFNVNGTSTFSGTLNIGTGANVEYASTTALSSATINVLSGGRLSANVNGSIGTNLTVADGGNLAFQNNNTGIFSGTITLSGGTANVHMFDWYNYTTARNGSITGKITGAGGLTVFAGNGATLTAQGANDYTGATTLYNVGLTVSGATGSIAGSSGTTANNSTLTLDYSTANVDKIKDTTGSVSLAQNAFLAITPNTTTNTTETMGTLGIAGGHNTITLSSAASRVTTLAASDFSRTNNSTALIRGTALDQSVATNVSRLTLADGGASLAQVGTNTLNNGAAADSTLALKIVPYLVGDTNVANNGSQFVTYDSTLGLRALQSGEYTTVGAGYTTAANPDNAAIGSSSTVTLTTTSDVTINSFKFGSATVTLNGNGGKLIINSGAILVANNLAAEVIGSGFSGLTLGNGTWNEGVITTAGTGALTINTAIDVTGGGGLTKAGAGTLTLTAANLYTGQTTVNQGTLSATTTNNMFNGTTGTALVMGNNATFNINSTTQTVSSIGFYGSGETVSGASGTLNLGGNITYDATVNQNAASTISVSTLNLNATRTITAGNSSMIFLTSTTNFADPDLIISSVIANGSGTSGLTKAGAGTVALTGASTYTGTTTISGGTLLIGNNGTTGALSASSAIIDNATLGFSRTNTVTQGTDFSSAAISGTGGITNFGSGTVVLNAANSFSGAVNIMNGTVSVASIGNSGSNSNLGTNGTINLGNVGAGNVAVTSTLLYTGAGETTDKVVNLAGFGSLATSIIDASGSGLLKFTSAVTGVDGSKTLTLQGTGSGELAGALNDFGTGVLTFTKGGTGSWTLSGANTYTGSTTVSGGTLIVTGALGGNTAVTVSNAGTALNVTNTNGLTGNSSLTVNSGATATLSAANNFTGSTALTGTLQLRNANAMAGSTMTMNNGSTLQLRSDADTTFATNGTTTLNSDTSSSADITSFNFDVNAATAASNKTLTLGAVQFSPTGGNRGQDQATINVTGASGYTLALGTVTATTQGQVGSNHIFNAASGLNLTIASIQGQVGSVFTFAGAGNTTTGALNRPTNRAFTLNFNQTGTVTLNSAAVDGAGSNSFVTALNAGTTVFNNAAAVNNVQINLGNQTASSTADANFLLGGGTGGLTGGLSFGSTVRPYDTTSGKLTVGGMNTSGTNTFTANMQLGNTTNTGKSVNLVAATGGTVIFSGAILKNGTDSSAGVTINDTYTQNGSTMTPGGTVTLSSALNTFTGATKVIAGTLALGNVNALSKSALDLTGAGAFTFTVSGTNTYNIGGLKGAGALNIGANSLTMDAAAISSLSIADGAAYQSSPAVSVTGAGTLTFNSTLTVSVGSVLAEGLHTFDLFGGTATLAGNFTTVSIVGSYTATLNSGNSYAFTDGAGNSYSFNNGTGNFALTVAAAVPEPATCALVTGLGVLALAASRRRRNA